MACAFSSCVFHYATELRSYVGILTWWHDQKHTRKKKQAMPFPGTEASRKGRCDTRHNGIEHNDTQHNNFEILQ
jgi:hypothetical protein